MTETALAAVYRTFRSALLTWGNGVYVQIAPAQASRPYIIQTFAGGGEINSRKRRDWEGIIMVKAVADSLDVAFAGAALIADQLNDNGQQEDGSLWAGVDWELVTCTQERTIQSVEYENNSKPIYHAGAVYRVRLETRI